MERTILGLYFDAPLQSWDVGNRHNRRGTMPMPTRSGIIGIIAAAMGVDKNGPMEAQNLEILNSIIIKAYSLKDHRELIDFHIAQDCRQADGKLKKSVLTYRNYLASSRFVILIETNTPNLLQEIALSLQNPKWGGWLGRKCCIPATPLCLGLFDSEEMLKAKLSTWIKTRVEFENYGSLEECNNFKDGNFSLNDVPLSFAKREYGSRRLKMTFFSGKSNASL